MPLNNRDSSIGYFTHKKSNKTHVEIKNKKISLSSTDSSPEEKPKKARVQIINRMKKRIVRKRSTMKLIDYTPLESSTSSE